jgi:hypothetical protein
MHNDPNFDNRLMRFAAGEDDPELQRHFDACPECRDVLATVRLLARARETTGDTLPELPEAVTASLQSLMPRIRPDLIPSQQPSIVGRIRERAAIILAELVLDSGATPALAGLRGTGDQTRQLAFVSDLADLDLELNPGDDGWAVTGQLGMDTVPDGLVIRFLPAGADPLTEDVAGMRSAAVSGEGYFDLTLPAGEWLAAVTMDDATILFREIVI